MNNKEAASILEELTKSFIPARGSGKTMTALRIQLALFQAISVLRATPDTDIPEYNEFELAGFDEEQCEELRDICNRYNIAPQSLIAVVNTYYPDKEEKKDD